MQEEQARPKRDSRKRKMKKLKITLKRSIIGKPEKQMINFSFTIILILILQKKQEPLINLNLEITLLTLFQLKIIMD